ncbi:MAG: hypothetical protein I8H75_02405 [Myxococcaceae bacterium]|nr:hypothetical protein [Myxococcaceae bacterium]MBH2006187.1 hypothetical protein [Myxococcaceae bacterium]
MSHIREAFESGNFQLVRRLALESNRPKDQAFLEKIKTDPKVYWAGAFGVVSLFAACMLTLY